MKIFSAIYGDKIKFDAKPNEDYFLVSLPPKSHFPIFAVADGVTQSHYPNHRYALPYGAIMAAKTFCHYTVKNLQKSISQNHSGILQNTRMFLGDKQAKKYISDAFDYANEKIKDLNYQHHINEKTMDYTTHDWFDTVGIAGVLVENKLHYGLVGDCALFIFDKNNKKIFKTKDKVKTALKRFEKEYINWQKMSVDKRTKIIHKDFRNNPNKKGYGSFTGKPEVKNYYNIRSKILNKGDMAILCSDGMFELLKLKDFLEVLRSHNKVSINKFIKQKAKENPAKYGHDRTFVSIVM